MLINDIDLAVFKGKLMNKDIQTAEVTIYNDWLRKSLSPIYLGKQEKFKTIKMQILIEDDDTESCMIDISNLVHQFEKCTIKFDDLDFYYDCVISTTDSSRMTWGDKFLLNIELKSGYAYTTAITETMDHVASKTFTVLGNLFTPVQISITASINTSTLTLTGFQCGPIVVNNLLAGIAKIISGEACRVVQEGANVFGDVDMLEFPSLEPGVNIIATSNSNCVITLTYKPKYI